MSDLRDLYQEMILDHNKQPRNFREITGADCCARGDNPLCGDKITIFLKVAEGVVVDAAFKGTGCAISTASASMLTEAIKGRPVQEVQRLFKGFHAMVTEGVPPDIEELGKLSAFSGVCDYPVRVKCATLAWHTLDAALKGATDPVSTED